MKALVIAILIATIAFSPLSTAARELVDYGKDSVTVNIPSTGDVSSRSLPPSYAPRTGSGCSIYQRDCPPKKKKPCKPYKRECHRP
ncbi:hypothetical protein POTOM_015580 [Populus tomentosa]|uniref:Uncharacterized protein n=1 Tax=Populus tomentosa TaxID=118781 RepID=A0A8X8A3B1_POPTO|nr:uncharacterized protein LOC118056063 [Populus alba]KAG6779207.1 hypothetical protein POTOM_015580 [Populus tomentosa]